MAMRKALLTAAALVVLTAEAHAQMASASASPPECSRPPSWFIVFFGWDRSDLPPQMLSKIEEAVVAFRSMGHARIIVIGHTDTTGTEDYNMMLSLRRANAVKDALVRAGVPAKWITTIGRGEQGQPVQTGDDVRQPENRRVDIHVI